MTITAIEVGQTLINPWSVPEGQPVPEGDEPAPETRSPEQMPGYHVAVQMRLLPVQDVDGQPMAISGAALELLCNPLVGYELVTIDVLNFPDGHPGDDKLMQAVGGNILARLAAARKAWVGRTVG